MVKISPLYGITYNQDKVNISEVIAPPYDVISSEEQEKFYGLSPYNIVRLILNRDEDRYSSAAKFFKEWLGEEVLVKSDKPCIYYYIQNYTTAEGEKVSRKGFIARNLSEEYEKGNVLPHEFTMGGPKQDRLNLMKACGANFSQIFMTYSDPEKAIDAAIKLPESPIIDVVDDQGIQNILYAIDDQEVINKIVEIMADKQVLIADGHHRYETSIAYRDWAKTEEANWVMSFYTNLDDENLKVYPTHRIVTRDINKQDLLVALSNYFDLEESDLKTIPEYDISFGIYFKDGEKYLARLREKEELENFLEKQGVPDVMKKLDLTVLHKLVLSEFLGFSEEDQMKQNGVKYLKKEKEAIEAIENGSASVVFIMATPSIQLIKDISSKGYKMPQKSTYFYPKLASGLVINPLV